MTKYTDGQLSRRVSLSSLLSMMRNDFTALERIPALVIVIVTDREPAAKQARQREALGLHAFSEAGFFVF
jgi:hypothetical protein